MFCWSLWKLFTICPSKLEIHFFRHWSYPALRNYLEVLYKFNTKNSPVTYPAWITERSTVTNLGLFSQILCPNLVNNRQVHVNYIDFSKAFDEMDHLAMTGKPAIFGISEHLIHIIQSYPTSRPQYLSHMVSQPENPFQLLVFSRVEI